jgi:hypothetical protein
MADPEERLKGMIGETGKVSPAYGGYDIKVSKPTLFPWYDVISELIKIGQDVWISKKEGKIHIVSEHRIK